MAKFQSVAASRGIRDIPTLIDLSFCCESVTVITDFSDLESVGKHHYLDTHGGCEIKDIYNALNDEAIARELIAKDEGRITPYGVLYENGMRLEPAYTEWSFPAYADKEYLVEVELAPAPAMPEDTPSITLFLPMPEKRLERLLERGGYRQGRIVCEETESNAVREIFSRYLHGESLQRIAETFIRCISARSWTLISFGSNASRPAERRASLASHIRTDIPFQLWGDRA